jgi:pyruvate dehydrogenase E2 component (dihydrolipoamide acetyltransferase)
MATKVHMEALSPTMEEGQLVRWLKKEGDTVSEGDVLAEIETDKATMELVARGSGVLQSITLGEGQTAPVGQVIAVIAAEGEAVSAATVPPTAGGGEGERGGEGTAGDTAGTAGTAGGGEGEGEGGGTAGGTAGVGAAAESGEEEAEEELTGGSRQRAGGAGQGPDGRVKASPLARRLASEAGLDLQGVRGSGPGGRITKADIEAAMREPARVAAPGRAAAAPTAPVAPARRPAEGPEVEEVPVSQMRKTIAKRLVTSIGPIPTFYLTIDIDMTRLVAARERVNARLEKDGIKASINDFIIKATAMALAAHPEVNSSWGDHVIRRHRRVHVGVAVAVEDGLITPVIRDADLKRVRDIAVEVRELAGRAREKKLKPEEYTGATFSVSNLGMFGIAEFTAIINPPESGILAIGKVEERVVAEDGQPVVRPRMRVTMSCDHRVVDGATGARFLQTLQAYLEEPVMMLA